ncbi:MAG: inositol monophosphatase [Rectinemataceae bacterium]|jgi:myo-inositol-1(or 4)-monophosphatase
MIDRKRLLADIRAVVAEVGAFLVSEWRKRPTGWASEKSAKDLVSFVDIEAERRLAAALKPLVPGSAFYGEEGERRRGELTWVVDPVDGTTNYVSGLDWFCVSVALFENDRPIIGIVHRPAADEWFWALRGGGAWEESPRLAARLLPAAVRTRLRGSLVCTGTPFRSPDTAGAFFGAAAAVTEAALDLRRLGSAALDLCSVAAGRLQAFWEVDLRAYDVGAALLLLEETGCPIFTIGGKPYDPFESASIVTGVPGAAEELRALVAPFYAAVGRV